MDTTSHESSDWLKRITYIRCVFRLVKKEDEKLPSNLHFTLNSLFESVDIIATSSFLIYQFFVIFNFSICRL